MQDYASFPGPNEPNGSNGPNGPRRRGKLTAGIIRLCLFPVLALLVFLAAGYTIKQLNTEIADTANQPELAAVVINNNEDDTIAEPPPDDYSYDEELVTEPELSFDEADAQNPVAISSQKYYILVEYFPAYIQASRRAEEIDKMGMGEDVLVKTEPYVRGGELVFRVRIGPYIARSDMNGARDKLFRVEIPHRILIGS